MDQGYQYIYPEGDIHGLPDYAGQAIYRGGEDLQGIMGPPPMSTAFPDQLSSTSDITASNSYHHPFLMVSCQADATQDLRLSPVQPSLGYAETGHGRNSNFSNDMLLNPSADQDAWNSLRVTGVSQVSMPHIPQALRKRRRINGSDDGTIHPSERAFSDAGSQCHAEKPPSDSAYGTKSVATASVIDSFNADDTPIVPSHGAHTNARNSISFSEFNVGGDERSLDLPSQAGSDEFKCSIKDCGWVAKSSSEKKKHETRHLKPFKCDQEGCNRIKEGFGTVNDLDRHRRSVHGLEPKNGESSKLYKCFAENCPRRDKEWPRQDNFRQHLRRMHGKSSVNDLMKESDKWHETTKRTRQKSPNPSFARPRRGSLPTPEAGNPRLHNSISSASGLGPCARNNIKGQTDGDSVMPSDITKDFNTPTIASELSPLGSSTDAPPNSNHVSDVRGRQGSCSNAHINTSTRNHKCQSVNSRKVQSNSGVYSPLSHLPSDAWDDNPTKTAVDLIQSLTKQIGIWDECRRLRDKESHFSNSTTPIGETPRANDDTQEKNDELQRLLLDGLRQLGAEPGNLDLSHLETSTNQSSAEHSGQQRIYKCPMPKCGKELDRQCKLTKHMKRHDRPYACTFPDCTSRRFGSKNDWKRHENSQHFQLQCWRCHVKSDTFPFAECNRLFYRREKFISHLDRDHKVTEEHKITTFLKTDEIGRNGQSRFWCGFCRKIIALNHRGMDAWNERFKHIDEQHFRHGEKIETWLHPEIRRSDSPVTIDHHGGKEGDHVSDGEELMEGDNGRSGGVETAQNVGGSDERTIQEPSLLPTIKIDSEQTDDNDQAAKVCVKCHRPPLRLDTSLPHSIPPQTQKRKFAIGPAATSAITRSHSVNQGHCDSIQRMALANADNPLSAHSGSGSAVSSHTNTTVRPSRTPTTRTNTAAALFPTMYPKKQAKNSQPPDVFSCCHCSGLVVKSLTDNCVMCGHQTCLFCESYPPSGNTPPK